jgi:hypothetical protein
MDNLKRQENILKFANGTLKNRFVASFLATRKEEGSDFCPCSWAVDFVRQNPKIRTNNQFLKSYAKFADTRYEALERFALDMEGGELYLDDLE